MPKRKDYIGTERLNKDDAMIDRIERGDTSRNADAQIPTAIERESQDSPVVKKEKKTPSGFSSIDGKPIPKDAWKQSKNKQYVRKIARQELRKDPTNKELQALAYPVKGTTRR